MAEYTGTDFAFTTGSGLLIAQAYQALIEETRKRGIEMTLSYHHNTDRPEWVEAMETAPFFSVYRGEKQDFLMYALASHPEVSVFTLRPERVANYKFKNVRTGAGQKRTETHTGLVIFRGHNDPHAEGRRVRVLTKVVIDYAENNNPWPRGEARILEEFEPEPFEEPAMA